ncbi:hypothetical protein ACFS7Z_19585 [Pontibacter toksunensis]|uniref:InsA N-terminal domain-containing protein n=1 Tax=Pontibacter toksunensis TaxID=1332631 RepID=A0ABW6C2T8_9BACT
MTAVAVEGLRPVFTLMNRSCYYCGSVNIVKNGRTYYGKARGKCKDCSRQFVFERHNQNLSREQHVK